MARQLGQSIARTAHLHSCELATGSWAVKADWCVWGAKASPCGPIQQMSYCCSNRWSYCLLWCQNIQCSTVCCVWGCTTAGQSGFPCWPLCPPRGNVTIGTGPRSNGRTWLCLTTHLGCVCIKLVAPGSTMGRRQAGRGSLMLWAVFCWKTLGPTIHLDVTLTQLHWQTMYTLSWNRGPVKSKLVCLHIFRRPWFQ